MKFQVALFSQDDDHAGIVFNYRDESNYYSVGGDRTNQCVGLYRRLNGVTTIVARRSGASFRR